MAALPWIALARRRWAAVHSPVGMVPLRQIARTRVARAAAVYFGLQSAQSYAVYGWLPEIYRSAGLSGKRAGLMLGIVLAVGIPLSVLVPILAGRSRTGSWLVWLLTAAYPVGYFGLMLAPTTAPAVWAVVIGIAGANFPLMLTFFGLRTRTVQTTVALSALTQAAGYALATVGPFTVGVLHAMTHSWNVPLSVLASISVPLLLAGLTLARASYADDELVPSNRQASAGR